MFVATVAVVTQGLWAGAEAKINGFIGPGFTLSANMNYITVADGASIPIWGYGLVSSDGGSTDPATLIAPAQYPGPTLIVNEGETVNITLTNNLPMNTSLVINAMSDVSASGGVSGLITQEAEPGGSVTYSFVADRPGTFLYQSGTRADLQVEMGLFGALIVRPAGFQATNPTAYDNAGSAYDYEHLFVLSEIDPQIHMAAFLGGPETVDTSNFHAVYWFINGRAGPDTLDPDFTPWLFSQPYGALVRAHPCERVLMRLLGAGRDLHPFHTHGNHSYVIGQDGMPLESAPGATVDSPVRADGGTVSYPDLTWADYTIQVTPGATYDAIFEWTGHGLAWDIYGHGPDDPMEACEDPTSHGEPFPVVLPGLGDLTFGGFYSGSPFLGGASALPPGEGGLNPNDGFFHMWHSHSEKELVNNDIFPGGMMTMFAVEPFDVTIE